MDENQKDWQRRGPWRRWALLWVWVICWPLLGNAATVNVDTGFIEMPVGIEVQRFLDPEKAMDITDIQQLPESAWYYSASETPSLGFNLADLWMRLDLRNNADISIPLNLVVAYAPLDVVEFYHWSHDKFVRFYRTGDQFPFTFRPVQHIHFVFPFEVAPHSESTVFVRANTTGALQAPVTLWHGDKYMESQLPRSAAEGVYYGLMIIMLLYNFTIFLLVRHISFFYYTLTVLSILVLTSGLDGMGYRYVWANYPAMNEWATSAGISGFSATSLLFASSLLNMKRLAPRLNTFILRVSAVWLIFLSFFWLLPYHVSIQTATFVGILNSAMTLFIGFYMLSKGQTHARNYCLAVTALLLSWLINSFSKSGLFPSSAWIEYSVHIGSAIGVLLFSFALAERINVERRARVEAHRDALESERLAVAEKQRYEQLKHQTEMEEMKAQEMLIRAEEQSKAKGEFLATMSHEIRTPMNGILGMATLLQDAELDTTSRHYVSVIVSSGRALLNIINDILDYSKIEAGKIVIEHLDFDLDELLLECASVFAVVAEEKQIELLCSISPDCPRHIHSDPTRLRQIILNLLGNAFKFTNSGQIALRIEAINAPGPQGEYCLKCSVTDSGIGIQPEALDKLFVAFNQADSSISRKYGGTGLGLSISRELSHLLGGEIGVESEPDKGSCFWFTLRCEPAAADFSRRATLDTQAISGLRLLIVDDSTDYARILREQAEAWGMLVEVAYYGEQALELARTATAEEKPFDIITLDMQMPGLSGIETALQIQQAADIAPCAKALITARRTLPDAAQQEAAGITVVLHKPLSGKLLHNSLVELANSTEAPAATPEPAAPSPASDDSHLFEGRSVLVVEDNQVNQMVISGMLRKIGVEFDLASNGVEGVNLYQSNPATYFAVLMDCEMPVMDGFEATCVIRELEADMRYREIPIIALTAHVLPEYQLRTEQAGMSGCLAKPVDLNTLRAILKGLVARAEPLRRSG